MSDAWSTTRSGCDFVMVSGNRNSRLRFGKGGVKNMNDDVRIKLMQLHL